MDIEKYVDDWAWWWARHIRRGSQYDYMWHRVDADGHVEEVLMDAFRFMHDRLEGKGPSGLPHKDMMRTTILLYVRTEHYKPRQKWADIIQAGEEPVSGAKLTIV